jgi:glucose/arabinose dehydrogenase
MTTRPSRLLAFLVAAVVGAGALTATSAPSPAQAAPAVQVSTVVSGLDHPWDLTFVGDLMLYDLRAGSVWSQRGTAAPRRVAISGFPTIFASGESGLLGMVADPAAATNKRFYTCQSVSTGGTLDGRVLRWRLTSDTTAVSDGAPVVTGLPISTGRHSGCRLRFGPDGKLYVGTGDAAVGTNPQNLASLGGKVLRVGWDGSVPTDNPFYSRGGNARYVWTYGHRNVQGLAFRPGTSEMWSAEHGTSRDDEVNLIVRGGNYGWDPVPGYDESRPMTDLTTFPSARVARWSSGSPTVATSGAAFLTGAAWGEYQGWLAVALLKAQGVYLMRLQPSPTTGDVVSVRRLPATEGIGRVRALQQGPDGSLYVTTDNGGSDRILRVRPTATVPTVRAGSLVTPSGVTAARTGSAITAFVRSTGDRVYFRRSTDDGRTWGAWTSAGVTSSDAPSAASSASGRVDLFTRDANRAVVHTWFTDGVRRGSANLGGGVISQHGSSLGDGTLDVWGVAPAGGGFRNHYDGSRWSGWRTIGGIFTSALSAAAVPSTRQTVVSGRGQTGRTYEGVFTATGGGGWPVQPGLASGWSARALGDRWPGGPRLSVSVGPDGSPVVERNGASLGVTAVYTSAPDVVTRSDGTFVMFGRGGNGQLYLFDARTGGYVNVSLGGVVT